MNKTLMKKSLFFIPLLVFALSINPVFADLGAECDSDFCHTEKKNEPVNTGEVDRYAHDDQDVGIVSVTCLKGEIEVIISRAVWKTFDEYDRKKLKAGETWTKEIPSASSWYDQTNEVKIVGKQDSLYNLDFQSRDN